MKKVKIGETKTEEIDWDKPQYFTPNDSEGSMSEKGTVLVSEGIHDSDRFTGFLLPCETYPNGNYSKDWGKSLWKPIKGEHFIAISNNDD